MTQPLPPKPSQDQARQIEEQEYYIKLLQKQRWIGRAYSQIGVCVILLAGSVASLFQQEYILAGLLFTGALAAAAFAYYLQKK